MPKNLIEEQWEVFKVSVGQDVVDPFRAVDAGATRTVLELTSRKVARALDEKMSRLVREIYTARRHTYNSKAYSDVTFEVPKNRWQHLRKALLPAWWLRRYPIKTKPITKTVVTQVHDRYDLLLELPAFVSGALEDYLPKEPA